MAWYDCAVFYHIYPLGMLGGGQKLPALEAVLPHLCELGVNALYLGPIFMSSTHGYDTTDYFHVDARLGTDDDFAHFVAACHSHGVRVIVDGVFNHVGRDFWGFKEALRDGEKSIAWRWFVGLTSDPNAPNGVRYDTWEGHETLVKLDLANPDTRNHLFGAVDSWIDRFDIDGIRLDAAACLTPDFIAALRKHVDARRQEFYLMGEVIHGDYRAWANEGMCNGTTNYEAYKGIWSSHNDNNFFEIAYTLNRQFGDQGIYRGLSMYSFVENHDVERLASKLRDSRDLFTSYAMMFFMPGIPSIYYGGEWGMRGKKGTGYEADLAIRPAIAPTDLTSGNVAPTGDEKNDLCKAIARFSKVRRSNDDIMLGSYAQVEVAPQHIIFKRGYCTICAISKAADPKCVDIAVEPGTYVDVLNDDRKYDAHDGRLKFTMFAHWANVLRKI